MPLRRSLSLPITLAIVMIALLVVLTVGWILLIVFALESKPYPVLNWLLLSIGTTFIGMLLAGTIIYLVLSIKSINLNRRQSNFIDSVTHELKSPIASMKLYLQTLNRHQVTADEQANFYKVMLEDLNRLDRLINQLLDAARLEEGRSDADREEVALDELIKSCASTACLLHHVPGETVQLDLVPCTLLAWRADLGILCRNLIDNAVKYAGTEPRVEVTLRLAPRDRVLIRIRDNGRGIPAKFRREIFGRFERLGLELEREKPGTGLGLYIVRNIARRLRAQIRVRDPESGPGTVFEVQIPGVVMKP
jgi:signal transduction histidine kinase